MVNPKQKGKRGEDEACEWLSIHLYDRKRTLTRNHNQTFVRCDIFSPPFIVEVKRQEVLGLDQWWIQIHKVHVEMKKHDKLYIPVVMFRQNRKDWEFLISAGMIGCTGGYIRLGEMRFVEWAKRYA